VTAYRRVATFRSPAELRGHLDRIGAPLPVGEFPPRGGGALGEPRRLADGTVIGTRFCIHPLEGWVGTADGFPTERTARRWARFGRSGAKLIWGGEAVAVTPDGRANPHQLLIGEAQVAALARLRATLVDAHVAAFGRADGLVVGLQLTHSGRFSRPNDTARLEPRVAFRHPVLDRRAGIETDGPVLGDDDLERLAEAFVQAAGRAARAGFDFVDVKHCHGYLGHELLAAHTRPGRFGGSFENRTRFLRAVVEGIRERVPGLTVGVRLSAFDTVPWRTGASGAGEPEDAPHPYLWGFGVDPDDPRRPRPDEAARVLELLRSLGVQLVNVTAGSPYYNPHVQRPALFPPSDGYLPPEDPLLGVARQVEATAALKRHFPSLVLVGSAYSYLQEFLPAVAHAVVEGGGADLVGLGRMVLSYPDLPADVLAGRPLQRKRLCRTFSDCTTAPRNGLPSGCYPLDPYYRDGPDAGALMAVKHPAP
jgi:2,4-dienoyl-CoA reductase-like NADH-dependent reductase (Old Yellow Enzyme family)